MWKDDFVKILFPENGAEPDIRSALELKYSNIPCSLYKYFKFDNDNHSINSFIEDTVWMAHPKDYNDPYDSYMFLSLFDKIEEKDIIIDSFEIKGSMKYYLVMIKDTLVLRFFAKREEQPPIKEEILPALSDFAREYLRNIALICCFSERNDSILMWSHYADNHRGFCVEYNFKQLPYFHVLTQALYPVIYSEEPFDVKKFLYDGNKRNPYFKIQSIINKNHEWEYEKEWRIIFLKDILDKEGKIRVPSPSKLYLGSNITSQNKKKILKIARDKNIEVYQSMTSFSKYGISYEKIM